MLHVEDASVINAALVVSGIVTSATVGITAFIGAELNGSESESAKEFERRVGYSLRSARQLVILLVLALSAGIICIAASVDWILGPRWDIGWVDWRPFEFSLAVGALFVQVIGFGIVGMAFAYFVSGKVFRNRK